METITRLVELVLMFKWLLIFVGAAILGATAWVNALHPDETETISEDWDVHKHYTR